MPRCPSCSRDVPDGLTCPSCGKPLATSSEIPTRLDPRARTPTPTPAHSLGHGRFLPGALLAGRYRIVALAGKGGMGEVYRADDLKLGAPVALKFLPEGLERDGERLSRFLGEVRIARQVAHPSVCRVYDVGEIDGHHFISMEYVDGEDLGSLLRRIGRMPPDKGADLARQISAGLAAAHDAGVLHRDLKPANVMIDGRGRARITDFGLAALGGVEAGEEARFGTPAYMSPEQLGGDEVTLRSDVYALGLVLYEMFTGKPPFRAASAAALRELQTGSAPVSPSSVASGLDPAVERVILRCLDPDPARRPPSALSVLAALPGGDPLAAAVAAGETPSPELVAAAGEAGGLTPAVATLAVAAILSGVILCVLLAPGTQLTCIVPMTKPPEALTEKAREILREMGYTEPPADSLSAFDVNHGLLARLERGDEGPDLRKALGRGRPAAIHFRYRQSPDYLGRGNAASIGSWFTDPPPILPGMAEVSLDPEGRLVTLLVVPPESLEDGGAHAEPDWSPLLAAAGLDAAALEPVTPPRLPPVYADRLSAWVVREAMEDGSKLLVEAAALGGRPVAFRVADRVDSGGEIERNLPGGATRAGDMIEGIVLIAVIVGAIFLARRNILQERGDAKGALRFAIYLGVIRLLWMLGQHHTPTEAEFTLLTSNLAWAMYRVGMVALIYLAIEPYARRLWPRMLVSWTRLLHGRLRDPLVGRDVLAGCAFGVLAALASHLFMWLPPLLGVEPATPLVSLWALESLRGLRHAVAALVALHTSAMVDIFFPLSFFLFLRILTGRTWIALSVVSLLGVVIYYPGSGNLPLFLGMMAVILSGFWITFFRFGFLSIMVGVTVSDLLRWMPLTFDLTAPYASASILALTAIAGLTLAGFRASLAGRALFRDGVFEADRAA